MLLMPAPVAQMPSVRSFTQVADADAPTRMRGTFAPRRPTNARAIAAASGDCNHLWQRPNARVGTAITRFGTDSDVRAP